MQSPKVDRPKVFESPKPAPVQVTDPNPPALTGPFEYPHLIVPIDQSKPTEPIGNQWIARLSPTVSSLVNFDVHEQYAGKACNLVFYLPPEPHQWWQHFALNSPGGINVSRLDQIATDKTTASNAGPSTPVGSVPQLSLGQGHPISSAPCEAGKVVGYRIDSQNGLDMSWFQMVTPASGLFMTVSG